MTLRDALLRTALLDEDATLFVTEGQPVTLQSPVVVARLSEDHEEASQQPTGMRQLMDVWYVRDVWRGLEQKWRTELGRTPTQDELLGHFMQFLRNDA